MGIKLGIFFVLIGLLGMLHQRLFTSGGWFSWEQFFNTLHHETLILLCFALGIGVLVGRLLFESTKHRGE